MENNASIKKISAIAALGFCTSLSQQSYCSEHKINQDQKNNLNFIESEQIKKSDIFNKIIEKSKNNTTNLVHLETKDIG